MTGKGPDIGGDERIERISQLGTAENTLLAYTRDMVYFWRWAAISESVEQESYPIGAKLIGSFVLDHVEGLRPEVNAAMVAAGYKSSPGKHAISTIHRRVKAVAWAHRIRGLDNPLTGTKVGQVLAAARRAESKSGRVARRSRAITKDLLEKMSAAIDVRTITGKRDRALLEFGFYTGGRRRSEISGALFRFLTPDQSGGFTYLLHRSKTDQAGKGQVKMLRAAHAKSLKAWIDAAGIREGYLFRSIHGGRVTTDPISPETVNQVVKRCAELVGENPNHYSAHGLRRGFITHCGRKNIPLFDVMRLTGHTNVNTVMGYYEEGRISRNLATMI